MFLVGITGGIASGKSTVSAMLEKLGAEIIDADLIAREVVQPGTKGLEEIVVSFGTGILNSDGTLSREALASLVFRDEKKRLKLEAILHPLIKERATGYFAASKSPVIVYVVPLLVEANVDYPFDLVVTIESGVETQIRRLIETRGLSQEQAQSRIMAQATEDQRVARSNIRIDGSLPLTELQGEVSKLWDSILLQASKKAGYGEN
jgi:dephospho-CoA kinase